MWSGFANRPEKAAKADLRSFAQAIAEEIAAPDEQADLPYHYVSMGRYAEHLERWQTLFPDRKMLVLDYAEMDHDLLGFLNKVCDFLEIERMSPKTVTGLGQTRHWSSPKREISREDAATMECLRSYYAPYNSKLTERFGLDLTSWSIGSRTEDLAEYKF